jgi:hypothetical protein
MTCFSTIWQTEPRTLKIISRVLVETDAMSSPALLKEGSAPEDGGWAVAASLDRKRDREEQAWVQDHVLGAPQFGALHLYHHQSPVIDRRVGCLAVGECWPAAFDNQKPEIHNNAP